MRPFAVGLFVVAGLLCAQTRPDFNGVWRHNAQASRTMGPGPKRLIVGVEQNGDEIVQKAVAIDNEGREQRMEFRYNTAGEETTNNMRGVPIKSRARWEGEALVTESSFRVQNPPMDINMRERMSLSADGRMLTMERHMRRNGSENSERLMFERGSDEDVATLRLPERTAGENYRNVQVLKSVPSSRLMETMLGFQTALGVRCDHCHIPNEWHRDDNPAKQTARKMLRMTAAINQEHLGGQGTVSCNTCHRGRLKPE